MKNLVLVAVLGMVAMGSAFAKPNPEVNDSWDSIRAFLGNVDIDQGFGASKFGMAGFFNACVEGDHLRSLNKEKICTETALDYSTGGAEGIGPQAVCLNSVVEYVTLPLAQTEKECTEWQHVNRGQEDGGGYSICVNEVVKPVVLPTTPEFKVYRVISGAQGSTSAKFLFKKAYAIPACN